MSLTITHAGGVRVWLHAQTNAINVGYSTRASRRAPGGFVRRTGDGLANPAPLPVRLHVHESTLAASYALAYTLVSEMESATSVESDSGTHSLAGIQSFRMRPEGLGVRLEAELAVVRSVDILELAGDVLVLDGSTLTLSSGASL